MQVVPGAQVTVLPPLQFTVHAVPLPQASVQPVLPLQSAVQPPFGQLMVQVLFPPQLTFEPVSTLTVHVLPPLQVTVLFWPVETVQLLVPSHENVQFAVQFPSHLDWPAQLVVHPVPHDASHVFFDSQL